MSSCTEARTRSQAPARNSSSKRLPSRVNRRDDTGRSIFVVKIGAPLAARAAPGNFSLCATTLIAALLGSTDQCKTSTCPAAIGAAPPIGLRKKLRQEGFDAAQAAWSE